MTREELLKSTDYWIAKMQVALYNCAEEYMKETGKNRTQLAEHLGVSKGYVTQLLSGDYDHRLSKMTELALACGYVPKLNFVPIQKYIEQDLFKQKNGWNVIYCSAVLQKETSTTTQEWDKSPIKEELLNKEVA